MQNQFLSFLGALFTTITTTLETLLLFLILLLTTTTTTTKLSYFCSSCTPFFKISLHAYTYREKKGLWVVLERIKMRICLCEKKAICWMTSLLKILPREKCFIDIKKYRMKLNKERKHTRRMKKGNFITKKRKNVFKLLIPKIYIDRNYLLLCKLLLCKIIDRVFIIIIIIIMLNNNNSNDNNSNKNPTDSSSMML